MVLGLDRSVVNAADWRARLSFAAFRSTLDSCLCLKSPWERLTVPGMDADGGAADLCRLASTQSELEEQEQANADAQEG
eukprot:COSAG02_NODE_38399_length_429_cov_1.084848_2_plen_78_part_01